MRLVIAAALLAGACAQPPAPTPHTPPVAETQQQADARTRADLHTQLGAAYFELGNMAVALEELNEALRAEPNYGPAFNMLGLVYMELREDQLAQQHFERALRISPLDSDANNNYGWFLCQRKRYDEAVKHFMAALRNPLYRNPDRSWVNAGICERERGDFAQAEQMFDRALKLVPTQPQALFQLAELSFRRSDFAGAKAWLVRLTRTGVQPTPQLLWLALRVERQLGDRDAEASYGLQLRRNFPNSREAQSLVNRQYE